MVVDEPDPSVNKKLDKKLLHKGGKLQKGRIFGNRMSKQTDGMADFALGGNKIQSTYDPQPHQSSNLDQWEKKFRSS